MINFKFPMKLRNFFSLFITILTLLAAVYSYFYPIAKAPDPTFNSDLMMFFSVYNDIFIHHGSFHHWFFAANTYLFPDAAMIFIFATFIKNVNLLILIGNAPKIVFQKSWCKN
jgi:hypothetical protein